MKLERKRVISIDVSIGPYESFIDQILKLASKRKSSYICAANVHMTVEAYKNKGFQQVVNNANLVTPDGMPLVHALKLLYGIKQDRVAGMDLMPDLLKKAEAEGLPVFFLGSTKEVLDMILERLSLEHPDLKIAGVYSPPFRPLTAKEHEGIENILNNSGAAIIFVSLGCPKQEMFMARMKGRVNAVMLGVGAAFPVYAGLRKRAPRWMQRLSLEWLYRLGQEPRRLFKRYAYTNTLFIYLLLKELLKKRRGYWRLKN